MVQQDHIPVSSRTIVVALDGSECSDAALMWAIGEATATSRELLLVHVVTVSDELATALLPLVGLPDVYSVGHDILRRAGETCERRAVAHSELLLEGAATDSLVHVATDAAMLVLGHLLHHPAEPDSVLGGCLHLCPSPLVVVKTPASGLPDRHHGREARQSRRRAAPATG